MLYGRRNQSACRKPAEAQEEKKTPHISVCPGLNLSARVWTRDPVAVRQALWLTSEPQCHFWSLNLNKQQAVQSTKLPNMIWTAVSWQTNQCLLLPLPPPPAFWSGLFKGRPLSLWIQYCCGCYAQAPVLKGTLFVSLWPHCIWLNGSIWCPGMRMHWMLPDDPCVHALMGLSCFSRTREACTILHKFF